MVKQPSRGFFVFQILPKYEQINWANFSQAFLCNISSSWYCSGVVCCNTFTVKKLTSILFTTQWFDLRREALGVVTISEWREVGPMVPAAFRLQSSGWSADEVASPQRYRTRLSTRSTQQRYMYMLHQSWPPKYSNRVVDLLTVDGNILVLKYIVFFCGAATQFGPGPPHSWGFWITHNDAPQ